MDSCARFYPYACFEPLPGVIAAIFWVLQMMVFLAIVGGGLVWLGVSLWIWVSGRRG